MSNFNFINNINNNNNEFPMKELSLHAWITKHYLLSDNQIGEMTKIIEIKMNWAYFSANQFWLTYVSLKKFRIDCCHLHRLPNPINKN